MRPVAPAALGSLALAMALAGCGGRTAVPEEPTVAPTASSTPTDPASAPVASFLRFATGDASGKEVPWGDEVVLSIERTPVARLDAATAGTRRVWRGCVRRTATVEARSCPIDVLLAIADRDRRASPVVIEPDPPRAVVGCARYEPPRSRDDETMLWLRPPQDRRDCVSDMAVAVTVSSSGRIVAVDFALSSP